VRIGIFYNSKFQDLLIVVLLAIFSFGVFKNIQYPLMWMDEADTAMFATRVLEYGYPKVHDGKNVLNHTEGLDQGVGVKEQYDAWIHLVPFSYYFAAIGVYFAGFVNDIYLKTAIVRIPFALIGMLGVFVLPLAFCGVLKKNRKLFVLAYLVFEIFSVFLYLNLRTVRHHTINLFLSASMLSIFLNYRLFGRWKASYYMLIPSFLILQFLSFYPMFFMIVAYFATWETISFFLGGLNKRNFSSHFVLFLPILLGLMLSIPLIGFFEIFTIMSAYSTHTGYGLGVYFGNMMYIAEFLFKYEYLGLFLVTKVIIVLSAGGIGGLINVFRKNRLAQLSASLGLYLVVDVLVISRMAFLFERYLLSMQPVIVIAVLIDVYLLLELLAEQEGMDRVIVYVLGSLFAVLMLFRLNILSGYVYELGHVYRGPMDYAIDYISSNFDQPESLVIATNYEEYVYMYYLGSKVIVGYVGNNLKEDIKEQPDIIIARRGRPNNIDVLTELYERGDYDLVLLPVFDYSYNNISELFRIPYDNNHMFKTKMAEREGENLKLFIKSELYEKAK